MTNDSRTRRPISRVVGLSAGLALIALAVLTGCTSAPGPAADTAAAILTSTGTAMPTTTDASSAGSEASERAASSSSGTDATLSAPDGSTAPRASAAARRAATRTTTPRASSTASPTPRRTPADPAPATTAARPSVTTTVRPTSSVRPPTTPVAPPQRGNINQTVPAAVPVTVQAPALTAPARASSGVSVQVTSIASVTTEARFPGEIAGPGLAVTIHIANSGTTSLDLDNTIVDLRGANGERAIEMSSDPSSPFAGTVAPGGQAVGVYVFTIPQDQRNPISVRFSYSAQAPTVLFAGNAQ